MQALKSWRSSVFHSCEKQRSAILQYYKYTNFASFIKRITSFGRIPFK